MNTFVFFEPLHYGDTATIFTVHVIENDVQRPISEFGDFRERAEVDPTVVEDLAEIDAQIERLAYGGVSPNFLRSEKDAAALPGKKWEIVTKAFRPVKDGPLRLYCVLLPHEVIILCNGDRKTADTAQKCPNVKSHFAFANRLYQKIHERLEEEPEKPSLNRIEEILEKERLQL